MTVTHVGSSKKYAEGWQTVFSGAKTTKKPAGKATAKKKSGRKTKR